MAAMSNYLENQLVDHILRNQTFSPASAANLYVALYTGVPTDAGGVGEVSGIGYARVPIARSLTAWAGTQATLSTVASSGTGGATSNNSAITFNTPGGSWGTVGYFGILDALTGGNLLFHGSLTVPQTVSSGNTVSFAASQLVITFA